MVQTCSACGFSPSRETRFCPQCGSQFADLKPSAAVASAGSRELQKAKMRAKKKEKKEKKKKDRAQLSGDDDANSSDSASVKSVELVVPPAASGDEASAIYKRMLAAVRGANRNNDEVVTAFKQDCKLYGQGELKASIFLERLATYFGSGLMLEHMLPQLVRLIPDDRKRKKLIKVHTKMKHSEKLSSGKGTRPSSSSAMVTSGPNTSLHRGSSGSHRPYSASDIRSNSSDDESSHRGSSSSASSNPASRLILNRYADNPKCSICSEDFDLKRRRHRCRKCGASVCHSCSPAKMLISPEQVTSDVKDYDPAHPQRVCTICAPILQSLQDGLNSQYANCHKENPHEAKTRLHMPYSRSLEKECRNAADIIGNFFRPDFGADSDRHIPVSFLKKAHGLAFLTVIKAGLLITAKVGTGIVIAKLDDGSWSAPSAIGTAGIGGGLEAGGEIVEIMIILGSKNAVKVFHRTQVNVGGGLSVAIGPYGREANAQAAASRGGFNANFSYSHSRGLFVGISLHGAVITCRSEMNSNFYGQKLTPEEILSGTVQRPRAAQCLYDAIENAMEGVAQFDAQEARDRLKKDDCIHCECKQFVTKAFSKKCKVCAHVHDK
ncbi:Sh3 domain-containing protein, partial [Globisporangium splendens]